MIAAGIDLSLTSTGVCTIETFGPEGAPPDFNVQRIWSTGAKDATTDQTLARFLTICDELERLIFDAQVVAIEGPSFGQMRQGGEHARAGLWWYVVRCFPGVIVVPPAVVKKYATGKGNAQKDAVLAAAIRRYPDADITGNDEADATVLAAIAGRLAGSPMEPSLPQTHLDALTKINYERTEA